MINAKIKEFEQSVADIINTADLPIELKRLVLFEIYTQLKNVADYQIKQENEKTEKNEEKN